MERLTIGDAGGERCVDIFLAHAAPGDRRQRQVGFDDGADGRDLVLSHRRRSGLDLGDAGARQRARNRHFLGGAEGDAGRLLAVAQGGVVEYDGQISRAWPRHRAVVRCC